MQPPRIVNRTVPKIIAISMHTVNRFPFRFDYIKKKHGSAHVYQHGLQGIDTVSYKTYRDTYCNTYQIPKIIAISMHTVNRFPFRFDYIFTNDFN
jgi:hypothetical protein